MTCKCEKRIRLGLFGISRSGKDYTIEDFIRIAEQHGVRFIHLSPMDMIRGRLGGKRLRDMLDEDKQELVDDVRAEIDEISETENIIVDEHCCYPSAFGGKKLENGYHDEKLPHRIYRPNGISTEYEVVFPESERKKYDAIFVMYIDPKIIIERMRASEGCKRNPVATEEDIKEWEDVERDLALSDSAGPKFNGVIRDPNRSGEQLWERFSGIHPRINDGKQSAGAKI